MAPFRPFHYVHASALVLLVVALAASPVVACNGTAVKIFYKGVDLPAGQIDRLETAINNTALNLCWNKTEDILWTEEAVVGAVEDGGFDVLLVLNNNMRKKCWSEETEQALSDALHDGALKHLIIYDSNAGWKNNKPKIPGLPETPDGDAVQRWRQVPLSQKTVQSTASEDTVDVDLYPIQPLQEDQSPNVGPAGTVGTWTGVEGRGGKHCSCASRGVIHGDVAWDPSVNVFFTTVVEGQTMATDLNYCHGPGNVYYSTTPMSYFLVREGVEFQAAKTQFSNTLAHLVNEGDCSSGEKEQPPFSIAADGLELDEIDASTVDAVAANSGVSNRNLRDETRAIGKQVLALLILNSIFLLMVICGFVQFALKAAAQPDPVRVGSADLAYITSDQVKAVNAA